jgi:hypothetical protein
LQNRRNGQRDREAPIAPDLREFFFQQSDETAAEQGLEKFFNIVMP